VRRREACQRAFDRRTNLVRNSELYCSNADSRSFIVSARGGLSVYAWRRDWFVALCGSIVLVAFLEHRDMPRHIFGIQGFNLWNFLFLTLS